jgi:Domain of unknown function (DUF4037)
VTAGAVFHDDTGQLSAARRALAWYPATAVKLLVNGTLWGGWGSNPRPKDYESLRGSSILSGAPD